MIECSRQENTSFLSPLTESPSHQETSEPIEEEPDQRRSARREECVLEYLACPTSHANFKSLVSLAKHLVMPNENSP